MGIYCISYYISKRADPARYRDVHPDVWDACSCPSRSESYIMQIKSIKLFAKDKKHGETDPK
jgi:hypothetical protein